MDLIANRYQPLKKLGEGAMGQVWLVEDPASGTQVALKLLTGRAGESEQAVLQLKQEFRLMTQLRHPHIVEELDYGVAADGTPYFTMEVVEGHGLDALRPMPAEDARRVLAQTLLALGYVHRLDLVHGDIKPENVRVKPDGTIKLMDFGLMAYAGRAGGPIKGTLAYLAPEVIHRGAIDRRTDLYAVGALAYELLTGEPPFRRDTPMAVLRAHVQEAPLPPSHRVPGLEADLDRWVMRLLAKEPLERFQSAEEALAGLGVEPPPTVGGRLMTSPLAGREAEMRHLSDRLDAIVAGRPGGALLLTGPAGMGKSRLVEEFRTQVLLAHVPCAVGMAQSQRRAPYGPWISVLKGLASTMRERCPQALAQHGPALVRLVPELAVDALPELPGEQEKARLQAALIALLVALAQAGPLVLVLGDWQWTGERSRELLEALIRQLAPWPTLVLITARDARVPGATPAPLPPLDAAGVRHMVGSMLGTSAADPALVALVAERSAGNPFHVERLLVHLVQAGHLSPQPGGWQLSAALDAEALPRNLSGLLLEKLAALDGPALAVVHVAALQGRVCELSVLQQAVGLSEVAVFEALGQLRREQILMQLEEGRYRFTQEQFQECLIEHVDPQVRQRCHAALATALAGQASGAAPASVPLKRVTAIARHAIEGHVAALAVPYALEAGLRLRVLYANDEAAWFLRAGLAALGTEPVAAETRLAYQRCLGDVLRRHGALGEAQDVYKQAALLAESLGEQALLGRILTSLARAYRGTEGFAEALRCCERAQAVATAAADPAGAARALVTASRLRLLMGQVAPALADAESARALAAAAGHVGYESQALASLGYLLVAHAPARIHEGIAHLEAAIRLQASLGDVTGQENAWDALGNARYRLGDWAGARAAFDRALALAEAVHHADHADFAHLNLAFVAMEEGGFAEAIAHAEAALAGTRTRLFDQVLGRTIVALATARLGRPAEAAAAMAGAIAQLADAPQEDHELTALATLHQAELAELLGDDGQAETALAGGMAWLAETQDRDLAARLGALTATRAARAGRLAEARLAANGALEAAVQAQGEGVRVRALVASAEVAMAEGAWDTAQTAATEALSLAGRLGSRYQAVRAHGVLGEVALATGQPADGHFAAMAALATALALPLEHALARFAQAACDPYDAAAPTLAAEAKAAIAAMTQDLDETARERFRAIGPVQRVLEGNFVGFSLPKAASQPAPLPPTMWGLNQP